MTYCPIQQQCKVSKEAIAVYTDEGTYTYGQLDQLIRQACLCDMTSSFIAYPDIASIVHFFALIRNGKVAFPLSPRFMASPRIDLKHLPSSCATLLSTSGTTGTPKIVMHTLQAHIQSAKHSHPDLRLTKGDCWFLSLPFNHVGGMGILFRVFVAGASLIIGTRFFELTTHLSWVPTQLLNFLNNPSHLPHLKVILIGGGPIPEKLCQKAAEKNLPLYLTYGMTEMASQIATHRYHPEKGVHFGQPLAGREIKIGRDATIHVRGETQMIGYYGCSSSFTNGWLPTQDTGEWGKYGLKIFGRKDRTIISGGENLSLEELEEILLSLPEVAHAQVGSRSCEKFGARPTAQLTLTQPLTKDRLRARLAQLLPRFKIPNLEDLHLYP